MRNLMVVTLVFLSVLMSCAAGADAPFDIVAEVINKDLYAGEVPRVKVSIGARDVALRIAKESSAGAVLSFSLLNADGTSLVVADGLSFEAPKVDWTTIEPGKIMSYELPARISSFKPGKFILSITFLFSTDPKKTFHVRAPVEFNSIPDDKILDRTIIAIPKDDGESDPKKDGRISIYNVNTPDEGPILVFAYEEFQGFYENVHRLTKLNKDSKILAIRQKQKKGAFLADEEVWIFYNLDGKAHLLRVTGTGRSIDDFVIGPDSKTASPEISRVETDLRQK